MAQSTCQVESTRRLVLQHLDKQVKQQLVLIGVSQLVLLHTQTQSLAAMYRLDWARLNVPLDTF